MSILQFQQKVKKDQPSQDPEAPSALAFLPALHVFSCDCIKKLIQQRNSAGSSKNSPNRENSGAKPTANTRLDLCKMEIYFINKSNFLKTRCLINQCKGEI